MAEFNFLCALTTTFCSGGGGGGNIFSSLFFKSKKSSSSKKGKKRRRRPEIKVLRDEETGGAVVVTGGENDTPPEPPAGSKENKNLANEQQKEKLRLLGDGEAGAVDSNRLAAGEKVKSATSNEADNDASSTEFLAFPKDRFGSATRRPQSLMVNPTTIPENR